MLKNTLKVASCFIQFMAGFLATTYILERKENIQRRKELEALKKEQPCTTCENKTIGFSGRWY